MSSTPYLWQGKTDRQRRFHYSRQREAVTINCVTAQHREMLDQVLKLFRIVPNYDLNLMREGQTLSLLAASVLQKLAPVLQSEQPDWVVVQRIIYLHAGRAGRFPGQRSRIAHVEAGLRSHDKWQPFPEEINRPIAGVIADMHFAPDRLIPPETAARRRAGILRDGHGQYNLSTRCTGSILCREIPKRSAGDKALAGITSWRTGRLVLVTAHRQGKLRRTNGSYLWRPSYIGGVVFGTSRIVYPVHRNPNIWEPVHRTTRAAFRTLHCSRSVDYLTLVHLMMRSYIVLTDSGGIQEEAPALGVPALVLRDVTERPEGVASGNVKLVGSDRGELFPKKPAVCRWTILPEHERMARAVNLYDAAAEKS